MYAAKPGLTKKSSLGTWAWACCLARAVLCLTLTLTCCSVLFLCHDLSLVVLSPFDPRSQLDDMLDLEIAAPKVRRLLLGFFSEASRVEHRASRIVIGLSAE